MQEEMRLITFDPLWETMKKKGVTTYTLITKYSFSKGTLDALKHNRSITLATLNDICSILDCAVEEPVSVVGQAAVGAEAFRHRAHVRRLQAIDPVAPQEPQSRRLSGRRPRPQWREGVLRRPEFGRKVTGMGTQ